MSDRTLGGVPVGPIAVPDVVLTLAGESTISPVWTNELGGLTFRIDDAAQRRTIYVKWTPAGTPEIDFADEANRLTWAQRWVPVPTVLEQGSDEHGTWLATAALPGRSAVELRWVDRPDIAAAGIGAGLRLLHDALPVDQCPFDWTVERRLSAARACAVDAESFASTTAHLGEPPPIDRLVVCHGDPCVPNTLLHDDGTFAAHVDLGSLGLADRWADLAVGAWSTEWNYGPGYDGIVYAAYGVAPDPVRIAYYRALWAAT